MGLKSKYVNTDFVLVPKWMTHLTYSELDMFGHIVRGHHRLAELSKSTGLSVPRTSQIVTSLERKGLIKKSRRGLAISITLSESNLSDRLASIFKRGQIDPRKILADSKLRILVSLSCRDLDKEKLALETGLSVETVRKYLRHLQELGVVKRRMDKYSLSSTVPHLSAFLPEWRSFVSRRKLREISRSGTILWECGNEFIFATTLHESPKEGFPTALTAMYDYGIELLVDEQYYHYIPWLKELKPEDVALDTVVTAPASSRMLTFTLLLLRTLERVDRAYLLERAEEMGIGGKASNMIRFLEGKKVDDPLFPTNEEFRRLATQYGVSTSMSSR